MSPTVTSSRWTSAAKSDDADWTVIRVIDRYMKLFGGDEECIGTWRFHMDQDLAIWKAVQLAEFYNHALFVPEFNSIKKHKPEDSDFFYTILDEIVDVYDNIYSRDDPTKVREGVPPRYGFHTNKATKDDLVTQMQRRFRDQLYAENDLRALDEAMTYEQKADEFLRRRGQVPRRYLHGNRHRPESLVGHGPAR